MDYHDDSLSDDPTLFTIGYGTHGDITSIAIPGRGTLTYTYDQSTGPSGGNLDSVKNLNGVVTEYQYNDAAEPRNITAVQQVPVGASPGPNTLAAGYNAADQLTYLTNANGATTYIDSSGFDGSRGSQTVTDALGDVTQYLYDAYGNIIRKISPFTDNAGNAGYVVTVTDYNYVADNAEGVSESGTPGVEELGSVTDFLPFEIEGADAAGARYTQQPAADTWTQQISYDTSNDPTDAGVGQVASVAQQLVAGGAEQITVYGNYAFVASTTYQLIPSVPNEAPDSFNFNLSKPQSVTVEIQSPGGMPVVQSQTDSQYDDNGVLLASVTLLGPDPNSPSSTISSGQSNTYTSIDSSPEIPTGEISATDSITAINPAPGAITAATSYTQTTNYYYTLTEVEGNVAGAAYGRVQYSINAAGQETYYAYNAAGQVALQYVYESFIYDNTTYTGWFGTATSYDNAGRIIEKIQNIYYYPGSAGGDTLPDGHQLFVTADDSGNPSVDTNYEDQLGTGTTILTKSFNPLGQLASKTDQYGNVTTYVYDQNGNLVRTTISDSAGVFSETLTVYDALNRAIWTANQYDPNAPAGDPTGVVLATHTIYNSLGEVIETDQYENSVISFTSVGGFGSTSLASTGTLYSSTKTYYNPAGQAIETISPSGLRTGTIYDPNGNVAFTGPLKSSAPDGGEDAASPTGDYLTSDFSSYTSNYYDMVDSSGNIFDLTIDANGHGTETYKNSQGQVTNTVYVENPIIGTVTWTGGAGTMNWSDAGNWSTGLVPGPFEQVSISGSSGTIIMSGGTVVTGPVNSSVAIEVAAGTTWRLGGPATLAGLTLNTGSGSGNTLIPGGIVDIGSNSITINYGSSSADPWQTIRQELANAYSVGWSVNAGVTLGLLTSSTVAADGGCWSIGYVDGSIDGYGSGYLPQTATQLIIEPALSGDAHMSGMVSFSDELVVDQHYGRTGQDWAEGDFNYDGIVNFSDLLIIAQRYGSSSAGSPLSGEFPASFLAQWNLALTEVAEAYSVDDGSGSTVIGIDPGGSDVPTPSDWAGIPAGGKDQVNFTEQMAANGAKSYPATIDVYDASGNLTDVYQPAVTYGGGSYNPHTMYLYDSSGNEIAQITPQEQFLYQEWISEGNSPTSFTGDTRFAYDAEGDMVQRTLPDGESESYTYDQYGNVLTHTDFDGNVTTYSYYTSGADAGMAETIVYGAAAGSGKTPQTVSYTYDALGREATVTDQSVTTTYSYDAFGNQSVVASPEGTISYTYDPATGNHIETQTSNSDVAYGYDAKGELTSVTVKELNGSILSTPLVTTYAYDAMGNKASERLPNGVTTSYVYDGENDLTQLTTTTASDSLLLRQQYSYNAAGLRTGVTENQMLPDGLLVSLSTVWTYDNDGRLTGEKISSGDIAADNYTDTYYYDLDSNRIADIHAGSAGTVVTVYEYNADDEMTFQISSAGWTSYTYDANGSQLTVAPGGNITTSFTYDVRNKMIGYSNGTTTATYLYDDAGDRVAETVNGTTTYYLTDTANPTGYDQPIEAKSSPTATPSMTYIIGNRIEAQVDGGGNVTYLIADGHGDTRVLANASATVTGDLDFDAFGGQVYSYGSTATIFPTGDAVTDLASGLNFNGDGIRERRPGQPDFQQRDDYGYSDNYNPVTLNAEIYGDGNTPNETDPSGHYGNYSNSNYSSSSYTGLSLVGGDNGSDNTLFGGTGLDSIASSAGAFLIGAGGLAATEALAPVLGAIGAVEGVEGGFVNATLASGQETWGEGFGVGFAGGLATSLSRYYIGCVGANALGSAIIGIGNYYFSDPADFTWTGALENGAISAAIGALLGSNCFVGGTPVLLGNGQEEAINDIHVGQRVATDGGAANSPTGTAAADPNATAVNRKTWREVTLVAGDLEVTTLESKKWLRRHMVVDGSVLPLADFVNVAEMGLPSGVSGSVQSITACPKIQGGPGRVVLATVTHLNDDLYHLTLTNSSGQSETLGVTGTHLFYDQTLGWIPVEDLYKGEQLRGNNGTLIVTGLNQEAGTYRVYNLTVEADHVYYVSDLDALVHNSCKTGKTGQYTVTFGNGMKYIGKGDYLRAIQSAFSRMAENGGLSDISWTEFKNDIQAFIAEAKAIAANGGIDGGNLLNIRNSPGANY